MSRTTLSDSPAFLLGDQFRDVAKLLSRNICIPVETPALTWLKNMKNWTGAQQTIKWFPGGSLRIFTLSAGEVPENMKISGMTPSNFSQTQPRWKSGNWILPSLISRRRSLMEALVLSKVVMGGLKRKWWLLKSEWF
ncbi:MAG: hypothetical protein WD490_03565 [Opitutales bacterium]